MEINIHRDEMRNTEKAVQVLSKLVKTCVVTVRMERRGRPFRSHVVVRLHRACVQLGSGNRERRHPEQ